MHHKLKIASLNLLVEGYRIKHFMIRSIIILTVNLNTMNSKTVCTCSPEPVFSFAGGKSAEAPYILQGHKPNIKKCTNKSDHQGKIIKSSHQFF